MNARRRPGGRPWSLRLRLVVAVVVVTALGLTVVGGASVALLRQSLTNRVDNQLAELTPQWRADLPPLRRIAAFRLGQRVLPTDYRVTYLRPDGRPLTSVGQPPGASGGPALPVLDQSAVERRAGEPFTVPDLAADGSWRVRAVPVRSGGAVAVARSLAVVHVPVERLIRIELAAGAIVLVLLGVAAAAVVRVGLSSLNRMEKTATAIAAGDLDRRVTGADPRTETGRLAYALNTMVERLSAALAQREESESRLRRFVADASHELRTPLTSIRGFAELYRRGGMPEHTDVAELMRRMEAEAIRMGTLVEDLLLLARLDRERPLDLAGLDLCVLARDAVHDVRVRDPDRQVRLDGAVETVRIVGDEHRLRQVVTNLVTNAVQHTPAGTPIRMFVGTGPSGSLSDAAARVEVPAAAAGEALPGGVPVAIFEVHDDGPGIPPDEAPYVFDRLYRGDSARSRGQNGSGLGLAITAAIVAAHHGRVELHTAPGHGARFRVVLPADPQRAAPHLAEANLEGVGA
ncbi:HAMP domain-containing sensor histidine kinase [Actinopolymorpha sp. B17G11]|uniref:sensor histidine kinase n=1 Tax=Actinopolymorpha sp. B17G11 TaxID=3160861 RepID=UPI0032E3E554